MPALAKAVDFRYVEQNQHQTALSDLRTECSRLLKNAAVGTDVGAAVGTLVGAVVGTLEGAAVGIHLITSFHSPHACTSKRRP